MLCKSDKPSDIIISSTSTFYDVCMHMRDVLRLHICVKIPRECCKYK